MPSHKFDFLPHPIPITEQKWPEGMKQFVSINCVTYNHEKYIRDAIEGFLMQETTFPVKIVVFEDCSTDGTKAILQEYEKEYPQLFAMFYQPVNTYGKPIRRKAKAIKNKERDKGKYIAMCEGDDYWTDPLKLQKQVDFLEENADCSLCYTKTRVKMFDGSREDYFFGAQNVERPTKFSLEDFIKTNNRIGIRTVSMLLRARIIESPSHWRSKAPVGDLSVQLHAGNYGKYAYLPEEMAVYRRGLPGAWSEGHNTPEWRLKQIDQLNKTFNLFDEYTQGKYHDLIQRRNKAWIKSRIEYALDHFNRNGQFKMIKRYYKTILTLKKYDIMLWMHFILGKKRFKKLVRIKKSGRVI